MFGKKRVGVTGEIDVSHMDRHLDGSRELLRMWASSDGPVTCLVNPTPIGSNPFTFGIALTDCVRHGAKAYAQVYGIDEADALARIWAGIDAERESPTDFPEALTGRKDLN